VKRSWEVRGEDLLKHVKQILHEGNVRRIVIKQGGKTLVEFPVTLGVVGALAAPMLAALGAVAALLKECTIEVERGEDAPAPGASPRAGSKRRTKRKV
jgi:hypothetical protein